MLQGQGLLRLKLRLEFRGGCLCSFFLSPATLALRLCAFRGKRILERSSFLAEGGFAETGKASPSEVRPREALPLHALRLTLSLASCVHRRLARRLLSARPSTPVALLRAEAARLPSPIPGRDQRPDRANTPQSPRLLRLRPSRPARRSEKVALPLHTRRSERSSLEKLLGVRHRGGKGRWRLRDVRRRRLYRAGLAGPDRP